MNQIISRKNKKIGIFRQLILLVTMYFFIYANIGKVGLIGRYKYLLGIFLVIILFLRILNIEKNFNKFCKCIFNKNIIIIFLLGIILIFSNTINTLGNILSSNPFRTLILNIFFDTVYLFSFMDILGNRGLYVKFYYLLKIYILCINMDNIFAIFRYFSEEFNRVLIFIYPIENEIIEYHIITKQRLVGLGGFFFGGGVQNAISLLLIYFFATKKDIKLKERYIFYILFIFNFIIGILISRTTILGLFLIIIYGISIQKNKFFKFLKLLSLMVCFIFFIYQVLTLFPVEIQSKINYFIFEQGKNSLKELLRFYNIVPKEIKTILIGDLKWEDINGRYYMGVDVGYLRYIFYGGIFFLMLMILFNYFLIPKVKDKKIRNLGIVLFLFYLILMLKGHIVYLQLSLLIWFIVIWEKGDKI